MRGTRFGIGVDPADGLLRQGAAGYQLTWMDAKVEDWVVTPRRGKAVEINALWYNALRLLEGWLREEQGPDAARRPLSARADQVRDRVQRAVLVRRGRLPLRRGRRREGRRSRPAGRTSSSRSRSRTRSWPRRGGRRSWRWSGSAWSRRVGLRTLAPGHPDYKATYDGDLRARDAAYHQGTVWPWLIGPFVDAWLRAHPEERADARHLLDRFWAHLDEACVGSISEIFDAEPPFTPRGCIAQGWSVAEVLRALILTRDSSGPEPASRGEAR